MTRYFSILMVTWALQGAPVMCMAGFRPHQCECPGEPTPEDASASHHHGCSGHHHLHDEDTQSPQPVEDNTRDHHHTCGHETDCAEDPCSGSEVIIKRTDMEDTFDSMSGSFYGQSSLVLEYDGQSGRNYLPGVPSQPPPLSRQHASDFPLQI